MANCTDVPSVDGECWRSEWNFQQALVPTLDALIMLTGLLGHSLVIFILAGRRRKRKPPHGTDTLLLALSASDVLLLLCLPFHTVAIALGRWPFGDLLCKVVSFLGVACNAGSAFMLAALATTRYVTVVHPMWTYRARAKRQLSACVALMWLPALVLAAPQFAFRAVGAAASVQCFAFLSNLSQVVYSSALFLSAFALPLAVIVLMYAKIYAFLRRTRREARAPQLERYQNQVTKTSALLVLVFTACWLPSYILMFSLVGRPGRARPAYRCLAVVARLLATSSSVVNPVLYVFMSHKFRRELLGLGGGWWGWAWRCRSWSWTCPIRIRGRDQVRPLNPMGTPTPSQG